MDLPPWMWMFVLWIHLNFGHARSFVALVPQFDLKVCESHHLLRQQGSPAQELCVHYGWSSLGSFLLTFTTLASCPLFLCICWSYWEAEWKHSWQKVQVFWNRHHLNQSEQLQSSSPAAFLLSPGCRNVVLGFLLTAIGSLGWCQFNLLICLTLLIPENESCFSDLGAMLWKNSPLVAFVEHFESFWRKCHRLINYY